MATEPENPCCTRWKEKWTKAAEGRAHLKKATKLLQSLTDKFQQENVSLKKALEEERKKADKEREGKEKEMILRADLENEISLLRRTVDADDKSDEMKLLKDPVSGGKKHIVQLQKLLEEERMRVDSEKKKAKVEKKNAEEAWKLVKAERAKVDEERQRANAEEKKVEELQILLEAMKEEADKARSKLGSSTSMFDIVKCDLEAEKQKVAEERKCADLERAKEEEQKKLVEELEKNVMVEKSRADGLSLQLEDARRKIEDLRMAVNKRSISRCSGEVPDHQCNDNSNVNTGSWMENLMKDEDMSNLVLQFPDSDDAIRRIEAEKEKALTQKNRADMEMARAEEQSKLAEGNKKIAEEEKSHADQLSLQLQESMCMIEELKKQIQELLSSKTVFEATAVSSDKDAENTKIKLLEEQLNIEKKAAMAEKGRADLEMEKVEEYKNLAEVHRKTAREEKAHSEILSLELKNERHKIGELEKQLLELENTKIKLLEELTLVKRKAEEEKEHANSEMEKVEEYKMLIQEERKVAMEERDRSKKLSLELEKDGHKMGELEKQMLELENSKVKLLEELNLEKNKVEAEKERTNSEMAKLEGYEMLVEEQRKVAMYERARSEKLSLDLEKYRYKIEELEKQMMGFENSKIKLLEELNLEKNKAEAEKEHANSELTKLKDYEMLIEEQRKVAMEERAHSERLSIELEKDRNKIGELEKQMQELENSRVKLLEELNLEKNKVKAEKERANSEMTKVEEYKMLVEVHTKVAMEERARYEKLSLELEKDRRQIGELEKQMQELENTKIKLLEEQLDIEKRKAEAEKEHADSKMEKVEEYKILAEGHSKVAAEESVHSEKLSLELEKDRHKIGEMEKQMPELFSCRKTIKACTGSPKNDINVRNKKRRVTEDRLEVEKQGFMKDEKGQDVHGVEVLKCRHLMEKNKKMATEENVCSEQLSHQISEDRRRIDEMQRQIDLLLSSQKMAGESVDSAVKKSNAKNPEVKLLERELKREKKRLKFSEQVAEIEKGRNRLLEQELNRLKLDFMQILHRLDVMGKICSPSIEGTKDIGKDAEVAHEKSSNLRNLVASVPFCSCGQNGKNPVDSSCMASLTSNYLIQTCQYTDPSHAVLGRSHVESISGKGCCCCCTAEFRRGER